ncbi:hypothetical protein [Paenibacillus sedimenti]|uniref:Uncharacterized protein n=1 Tax=Paenibacillus sedimenti TaxID=2770274 RepID=A0A926QMS3_9BACL|nr:hypothetical protein [Paenibacillus sedimenti]MBD0383997.1 hypothetical protein [Paenibacillus sedimenti]
MKKFISSKALLAVFLLALAAPATVSAAASLEITPSMQSSLDKTIAGATQSQASKIKSQYNEFLTFQNQDKDWDAKISALYKENVEKETALNKQIKEIDAAKLAKLEAEVTQARERYKPLFSHYTALNKQIEAARLLKNKDLNSMLRFQANALRIPVQLARMDIKAEEEASREAKDKTSKTMKKIRGTLADIDPINVQIKAKKGAIRTTETSITPLWSAFKQAVKKGDAQGILSSLAPLISLSRQINEEKEKIIKLETKISEIIAIAKAQVP